MKFAVATYQSLLYGFHAKSVASSREDQDDEDFLGEDEFSSEGEEEVELTSKRPGSGLPVVIDSIFVSEGHIGSIKACAATSCGKWLVSSGMDESIHIYDCDKMVDFGTLMRHRGTVTCLKFFQSSYCLSGGDDGRILVWKTAQWKCQARLKGHKGAIHDIAIHPTGRVALSVGKDATLRMWDLSSGKLALTTRLPTAARLVAWSPGGKSYVYCSLDVLEIFDSEGSPVRKIEVGSKVHTFKFLTPTCLATGSEDGIVRLFDPSTGEPLQTLEGHESRVRSLDYAWVGEGKLLPQLVSVSSDGVVLVWDPSTTSKCTGRKKSNARLTAVSPAEQGGEGAGETGAVKMQGGGGHNKKKKKRKMATPGDAGHGGKKRKGQAKGGAAAVRDRERKKSKKKLSKKKKGGTSN